MVLPASIAIGSSLLPIVVCSLSTLGCLFYGLIMPRRDAWSLGCTVLVFAVLIALGAALIGFGVYSMSNAEPHCVDPPGSTLRCIQSAEEQVAATRRASLMLVIVGTFLVVSMVVSMLVTIVTSIVQHYRSHRG